MLLLTSRARAARPCYWASRLPLAGPVLAAEFVLGRVLHSLVVMLVLCGLLSSMAQAQEGEWIRPNPSSTNAPMMAFDSARGVTVLYGPFGSPSRSETWEWNGLAWTQRFVNGPNASSGQSVSKSDRQNSSSAPGSAARIREIMLSISPSRNGLAPSSSVPFLPLAVRAAISSALRNPVRE
jgi:hypothetical protein